MLSNLLGIEMSVLRTTWQQCISPTPAGLLPTSPDLLQKDNDISYIDTPALLP